MSNVVHLRQIVQVKKIRQNGYAVVDLVNPNGTTRRLDKTLLVSFPDTATGAVSPGTLWEVSGKQVVSSFVANDFTIIEYVIRADTFRFLKPSGLILGRWISRNVKGIGIVIARRLVRTQKLHELIKNADIDALALIVGMTPAKIERLIEKWPSDELYRVVEWLEDQKLPINLADKLVGIFGEDAIKRIKLHPFMLMAMGLPYKETTYIAKRLGLRPEDDHYRAGVAQYAASRYLFSNGSTVISKQDLITQCRSLIRESVPENIGKIACEQGLLVEVKNGYQVYGTALMESSVAQFLVDALHRKKSSGSLAADWEQTLNLKVVEDSLSYYEKKLNLTLQPQERFTLTPEQRCAVVNAVLSPVCCISGGAGTGKTTILKAVLGVYNIVANGLPRYQVALAGRAAQRMAESTGVPAMTIAKLIAEHLGECKSDLPEHLLLVIDEASMVDLLSMYRLIGILPLATRLIFVGDTSQLPPVGNGIIFHSLTDSPIPFFNLSLVKRQSSESLIHKFAMSVRNGNLELPQKTSQTLSQSKDCSIECHIDIDRLIQLWRESGGVENSIVLSPVNKGVAGVNNINLRLQQACGENRVPLYYKDYKRGWIPWVTPTGTNLLMGDPVLITANNYDEDVDLRNGDLGIITEVYGQPDINGSFGIIQVNNKAVRITQDILEELQLGYAITIHKAQGSQWETCFVMLPSEAKRMIDQTLLYTASTRPTQRLVLMGEERILNYAMARGSIALSRNTFLRDRIATANILQLNAL
jgi:exodeoxyribonuclease V alpha subunit